MDKIINNINNEAEIQELIKIINNTQKKINNIETKKCTFVYGDNGIGKTTFVKKILSRLNYNVHEFNILCQKNKNIIEFYEEYNCQNRNIMDIFNNINNNSAILIDNIDLINSVDKNTLSSLIKILRPKKYKRNSNVNNVNIQLIIIGTNDTDKKVKELLKVCNIVKINPPSRDDIYKIIKSKFPKVPNYNINNFLDVNKNINYYLVDKFIGLYKTDILDSFLKYSIDNFTNNNVKYINYHILKNRLDFNDDNNKINDTDRTTVSLLYHENIIDYINYTNRANIKIYKQILENFCFGDYMDRIIFQKQLWQLNEISFKIKVIHNNMIFHDFLDKYNIRSIIKLNNIRFTKILTKYSSEFNNYTFIINMCQYMDIDKKDLILLFFVIKNNYIEDYTDVLINKYNISILDINRLIKFISILSIYEE